MPAVRHLLLIVATLHAQMPCCLLAHAFWAGGRTDGSRDGSCEAGRAHARGCDCCRPGKPVDPDRTPGHAPKTPPGCPPECPADCQCMFCSVGFVPLTDFACTARGPDQAVEPLVPADIPVGLAGYRLLLDRPPRLS
jgi:hypothetical protein